MTYNPEGKGAWYALDNGSDPNRLMICQYYPSNDAYAWTPYCPQCNYNFNVTRYFASSTWVFSNGSILTSTEIDDLLWNGLAMFNGTTYLNGPSYVCVEPLHVDTLDSCDGTEITITDDVTVNGNLQVDVLTATSVIYSNTTLNGCVIVPTVDFGTLTDGEIQTGTANSPCFRAIGQWNNVDPSFLSARLHVHTGS